MPWEMTKSEKGTERSKKKAEGPPKIIKNNMIMVFFPWMVTMVRLKPAETILIVEGSIKNQRRISIRKAEKQLNHLLGK